MDTNILEFLRNQSQKNRVIIDKISGIIFQTYPNIKEKNINSKLKYIDTNKGSIALIYIKEEKVYLQLKNKKIYIFENYMDINKEKIEDLIK